ncbi:MAG: 2-C-methyl-D-erythritol 2,4-cyclodiphosphate synthase [Nitrospirae bacterium]|nr:2-C-methyl-D-erythritol 2,4-cyclodiphosphate synthase [Nitrospirota bacterium]
MMRIGFGYDIHRLVSGKKLILGGVKIPFEKGLSGHSDADVLLHAISDALLGAMGLGDLGKHFPDTDEQYKGISSIFILRGVLILLREKGYHLISIDSTVVTEEPLLAPYIEKMKETIAGEIGTKGVGINIKAKRNEGLGSIGRGEGIAAYAVCLIKKSSK